MVEIYVWALRDWIENKMKNVSRGRSWKSRGEQFVETDLPQVLKRQVEKQRIQVQGNRLLLGSTLKIFIKPFPTETQTKRQQQPLMKGQIKIQRGLTAEWFDSEMWRLID